MPCVTGAVAGRWSWKWEKAADSTFCTADLDTLRKSDVRGSREVILPVLGGAVWGVSGGACGVPTVDGVKATEGGVVGADAGVAVTDVVLDDGIVPGVVDEKKVVGVVFCATVVEVADEVSTVVNRCIEARRACVAKRRAVTSSAPGMIRRTGCLAANPSGIVAISLSRIVGVTEPVTVETGGAADATGGESRNVS